MSGHRLVPFVVVALASGCSLLPLNGLTGGGVPVDAGSRSEASPDGSPGGDADTSDAPLGPQTAYVMAVLADGPLAYWRLDEASGMTARDWSGNGNDATYIGGVTLGAPGAIAGETDTAASFDGSSGYLDAGDRFAFASVQAFSVEAWVEPASVAAYAGIASREDTSGGPPSEGYMLFVSPNDGVLGFQRLDGTNLTSATSTATPPANAYTHVVATFDGAQMLLYVDGTPEPVQASSFSIVGAMHHFVVGAEVGGGEDFFQGAIDEVAVYDHALAAARVTEHYRVGTGQGP